MNFIFECYKILDGFLKMSIWEDKKILLGFASNYKMNSSWQMLSL